jgi:hypothetical protein
MAKSHVVWAVAVVTAALAWLESPSVRAADGPRSELLKKHGLKIVGSLAVVETETDIKAKLSEAKRLSRELSYSLMQQKGTLSPKEQQQNIKALNDQISQIRSEINAVTRQMSMVPRGRARFSYGFSNNYAAEQFAELNLYRNQLQAEAQQDSAFLDQLKSQSADPKAKDKIDAEVRDKSESIHQAVLDLRKLVDSANLKYAELAKDDDFKKAFGAMAKRMREKPKLGPSHEFLNNVKLLEKLEKSEANGEELEPLAKPARRSRYGTKAKHSLKAGAGTPAPDDQEKRSGGSPAR